jgi:hypothetical protein
MAGFLDGVPDVGNAGSAARLALTARRIAHPHLAGTSDDLTFTRSNGLRHLSSPVTAAYCVGVVVDLVEFLGTRGCGMPASGWTAGELLCPSRLDATSPLAAPPMQGNYGKREVWRSSPRTADAYGLFWQPQCRSEVLSLGGEVVWIERRRVRCRLGEGRRVAVRLWVVRVLLSRIGGPAEKRQWLCPNKQSGKRRQNGRGGTRL